MRLLTKEEKISEILKDETIKFLSEQKIEPDPAHIGMYMKLIAQEMAKK